MSTLLAAKADASYDLAGALEGDDLCRSHAAWAEDVFARRADELTADNAIDILHEEVGVVFGHVLDNAGVFKWDESRTRRPAALYRLAIEHGPERSTAARTTQPPTRQRRPPATSPTGAVF